MMNLRYGAALLAAGVCLAATPAAMASGPGNIPFGNGSGGGAQSGSGSGSGGSGSSENPQGGGGGATVTRTCTIGTFSNSVADMPTPAPTTAAVVTQFAVPVGCPTGSDWHLQYINDNTGALEFQDFGPTGLDLTNGGNKGFTAGTSGTEVFSTAQFSTPYTVHMEIDDVHDQLIVQANADVLTPGPAG
jgi:hypothetical protein